MAYRDPYERGPVVVECPECGAEVDEDGAYVHWYNCSPEVCEYCGWRPCDGSCLRYD